MSIVRRLAPLAVLFTLTGLPLLAATAGPGDAPTDRPTERRVEHLAERLQLDASTAEEVAGILARSHHEVEQVKTDAKTVAQTLRDAVEAGDEGTMASAMAELKRIKADAEAIQDATQEELEALLTVEQQARLTLLHLHRRQQHEKAMHHLQGLRENLR